MKLTSNQIQQLYKFTRQHYVEHFDVQTELVDHLANDIEQIWQEQPKLSFEQARDISFKKFGVFGFMDVVEARSKALSKKYWELVWNIFKQFFTIPQILISITIFLTIAIGFDMFSAKKVLLTISIGVILALFFRLYFLQKEKKKRFKQTQKKWLLEEYIFNIGGGVAFLNLFFQLVIYSPKIVTTNFQLIMSFILTVFILLIYITTFILPSKIEEILRNQYPEYKLV
ncbi:hypothetical protein [Lutibacter sp.]|uniref:hypothetical protein n=1 Tax=Lutibacter sp. TaxID=1925666 RepID=UPI0025B9E9D6|nr:hypothetical protein [Lutibacter sp.]MCF6168094.1 hypothetical protein [Lutibacter sp.]